MLRLTATLNRASGRRNAGTPPSKDVVEGFSEAITLCFILAGLGLAVGRSCGTLLRPLAMLAALPGIGRDGGGRDGVGSTILPG